MIKIFLFVWCMLLTSIACFSHNPSETHSSIEIVDDELHWHLDLPWTIADAVKETYPTSGAQTSEEAFFLLVKSYIASEVVLTHNGVRIPFTDLQELPQDHNHSARLELVFPIPSLKGLEFQNTLLFNINSKQENYHLVKRDDGNEINFVTTHENANFDLGVNKASFSSISWPIVGGLTIFFLGGMYLIQRTFNTSINL